MVHSARPIPISQFKARCLALIDEVASTGIPLVITRRGRPLATVQPLDEDRPGDLRGSVVAERDLVSPIDAEWD